MSLQSLFFVFGFLPLFLLAYYCIKDNLKNLLIVAGSCAFYAFCSRKALVYLIIIFLMTYVFSLIIDFIQSKKQHNNIIGKLVFGIILSLSLIPLVYFKYKTFFLSEISSLFNLEITPNYSSDLNSVGGGNESFPGLSFITFIFFRKFGVCAFKRERRLSVNDVFAGQKYAESRFEIMIS